jgi:hypothetical protein
MEPEEEEYEYTHIWIGHLQCGRCENPHYIWVVQVVFPVEVLSVLVAVVQVGIVEMHLNLYVCSASVDSLLFHCTRKGAVQVIFTTHSLVPFHRYFQICIRSELMLLIPLMLDLRARLHVQLMEFHHCGK